jgi:hypothetical protein
MQAEAVWLVGQVPQDIRQQLNLPGDAKGIDGVFRTRAGVLVPYQVKFRSRGGCKDSRRACPISRAS